MPEVLQAGFGKVDITPAPDPSFTIYDPIFFGRSISGRAISK